jgi:acetyl esterase/lipase
MGSKSLFCKTPVMRIPVMRIFIIILFSLLIFTACKTRDENSNISAKTMIDISYGTDPKQKMDLYLPANRSLLSTKVIFLIHGGGWAEGDKMDFNTTITTIQSRFPDYAVINVNYRLAGNNQNLFPSQENDVKAAVEFAVSKKNEYTISDKWVFLGASAGAHLALLQAYKYSNIIKPKAVVSFFGPTDLTYFFNNPLIPIVPAILFNATGTIPSLNAIIYQQSSPVTFVTAQSCPTLLLQGGKDSLVPAIQATILKNKLDAAGVPNQYIFYPNNGHGWGGPDQEDSFSKIEIFLKQYVN